MKAAILFTGGGPLAILTAHDSLNDPDLLSRLRQKGVGKFMGFELPVDTMRDRYGPHFNQVVEDNKQDDALRVLDNDGTRIFERFPFAEFGPAMTYEPGSQRVGQA